jgi:hypothetical protein
MKKEIHTPLPFTKAIPLGCLRGEKNFGELDPSATTHPQMEAPSSREGSQVGITQDQELKAIKTTSILSTGYLYGQPIFFTVFNHFF